MFTNDTITSLKELMAELLYDWQMTANPQLRYDSANDSYEVNKTNIFKQDGKVYLTYKTSSYLVLDKAFADFKLFYNNLYLADEEFEEILGVLQWDWLAEGSNLEQTDNGFRLGKTKIFPDKMKYFVENKNLSQEISKQCYQKITELHSLLAG